MLGLDLSPRMIELGRERVPSGKFHVHDLARPLDRLPDGSVDPVLFALALEYVDDRISMLREFRRVLRPEACSFADRSRRPGGPAGSTA